MNAKHILQICIKTLKQIQKENPNKVFKVQGYGANCDSKVQVSEVIDEAEKLYNWCYHGLDATDLQKVTRCKDCEYYKRFKKKTAYKPQVKYLCTLDKKERGPEFYCANAIEKERG